MLYQVFSFGYDYASEGGLVNFFFLGGDMDRFLLVVLLPVACIFFGRSTRMKALVAVDTAALIVVLSIGNCYGHYFTLLISNFLLGTALLLKNPGLK